MLRVVPGHESRLPEPSAPQGPENCDHCRRTIRTRRDTFVVRWSRRARALATRAATAGSRWGRTCTQDFLGGVDPHAAAAAPGGAPGVCGAAASAESDDEGAGAAGAAARQAGRSASSWGRGGPRAPRRMGPAAGGPQKRDCAATADDALYYLDPPRNPIALADWRRFVEARPVTDADRADAMAALEYARGSCARPRTSTTTCGTCASPARSRA